MGADSAYDSARRKRGVDVLNGILYVLGIGCQWRALPGNDAGKKIKGKKRHLLVDTHGLTLGAVVHPANVQDRDDAVLVLDRRTRRLFPFLEANFADSAHGGLKLAKAIAGVAWKIEVVKKPKSKRASRFFQDTGSWSAISPGTAVADACLKTAKI